jgi:hypothetical protein
MAAMLAHVCAIQRGHRSQDSDSAGGFREGDGGRCTDRTCDLTRVEGVLYR